MKFFGKDDDDRDALVIEELRGKVSASGMPQQVEKIANQEIEVLSRTSPSAAEFTIGLTYINYLVGMPWNKKTQDNLDISRAEAILNEEHYGLQKTKERILEHLAVKILRLNSRPRILVVDDEEIARKNLSHVLEKEGYDTFTAADGNEAFARMGAMEFDVVITDLKMAGMDGMETLERIRVKYPDLRVIMITGYATVQSAIEAMQKGAFYYIAKPFKLDEVRSTVKKAVEAGPFHKVSRSPVFCFAGPPGTGKTSLGRSIARSLGRKFVRISLAGMKDEAEIRGHRRTYAGAMPGRIMQEIHRCESANPVIMLDEVDKIGHDFKGDPASALLEVLDPEQNRGFLDRYLDLPFDLSGVMFILTANVLDNIPSALRDRMEVLEFSGYTLEEKVDIASRFIVPRQLREKGLIGFPLVFTEDAIIRIIQDYTREAGIRNLERRIADICRKIAKMHVQGEAAGIPREITPEAVTQYLGRRRYTSEVVEEEDRVGVATGLVRTPAGGDIIFVEAARMKGKKELLITGQLGDVMRESAQAALSYIRSNAPLLGIPEDFFEQQDIHIHVPAGAIQKDGPSAGLTIAVALISMLTSRPARRDIAMTGEITLTGKVLPVGGIKEKVLAARRAKVKVILLPEKNRVEADELSEEVKRGIEIKFVASVEDAAVHVLQKRPGTLSV